MSNSVAAARGDLSFGTKLAYGVGSIAYGAKLQVLGLMLFYYNQMQGLPAHLVSGVLSAAIIIDALWDPLVGQVSDNARTPWGRRHPFMYASALPVALCVIFMLNPPAGLSQTGLLLFAGAMAIGARMAISLYEIPNTALVAELAPDYDRRTTLMSWRYFFQSAGTAIAISLSSFVFLRPHGGLPGQFNKAGYGPLALTVGVIMFASIVASSLGTHGQIRHLKPLKASKLSFADLSRGFLLTISNRNLVALAISGMLFGFMTGLAQGLTFYFNTYLWGLSTNQIGTIALSALVAAVPAVILTPILSRRFGKKPVCMSLFLLSIVALAAPFLGKLAGVMPPSGSKPLVALLLADHMCVSALSMMGFIIVSSMIADIVEEIELATGQRSEGLLFAMDTFLQKITTGVATGLPGFLLLWVGLPVGAHPKTVNPQIMIHLVEIYLPTVLALCLTSLVCIVFYRIDRGRHQENLRRIADAAAIAETGQEVLHQPLDPAA